MAPGSDGKRSHLRHIRDANRIRVLGELLKSGGISRHDLSGRTGLTQASVSRITKELIDDGLCYEGAAYRADNTLGRKRVELHVNPDGGYILGLCLSIASRMAVVTDMTGKRRGETRIPARAMRSAAASLKHVQGWLDDLFASGALDRDRLLGGGMVIAGSVDHETGRLTDAPLLKWRDVPIRDLAAERFGCPVVVENIADGLGLSYVDRCDPEAKGQMHMFLVHVAYGMGASLIIDNSVVRRRGGDEGWIGQLPLPATAVDGLAPTLQDVSSGAAILEELDGRFKAGSLPFDSGGIAERLEVSVDASNSGEPSVERSFSDAGTALGRVLMLITSAYLPDVIVLAGPVASAEAYSEAVRSAFAEAAAGLCYAGTSIVTNQTSYIEAA
ncbi:MAG: ROK family transcriptional regulator, partial [Hyphomicrobiaceae bacterium]|nr:ROK family transcriptional regulator [Hyphomicrobiaceae bacterium]